MLTHHHDHDHDEISAGPHTHLSSVGIDIGSSTSHLMFSQLRVGYPSFHRRRPEVLDRKVIGRSSILLTPFSGDWNIEAEPLKDLIDSTFLAAGLRREEIDTGAVIITGEAARRDNARRIAELFADQAGRFVCATAGPRLETVLASHGSGAVARSREEGSTLLNVDLGGGTTKVSFVRKGKIEETTVLNLGARLVAYDERGSLVRLERAGNRFLKDLGYKIKIGDRIGEEIRERLASSMAGLLFDVLAGKPPAWKEIFVTPPMGRLPQVDGILFSGGVSEYIYQRERAVFGDLGPHLGKEVREQAQKREYRILDSSEGIRATVIGASQYSIQLSGETIFIPERAGLPLRNLRVLVVQVSWESPVAERSEKAIKNTLGELDLEVKGMPFALVFSSPPFLGYGAAQELAKGIRQALLAMPPEERPRMLVFEQNVGRVVGEMLPPELTLPCVDEISLSELDFIDVGEVIDGEDYVPVVVKSLAFGV
ncbi:MAG: ethanolamine ammonia-lyase reactivating factor EutA [Candidatus Binatia bacterium]